MRPARSADPPHRPDHSKKPRSPPQSPSPDRLPDPSGGAPSFTHSDTDTSLPPIATYPTPQLGSKMTKARTAAPGSRWVDRAGADGLTGRHEIILSSGSSGTGGSWDVHGKRWGLASLAWTGPERHFAGEGLAGAVAG